MSKNRLINLISLIANLGIAVLTAISLTAFFVSIDGSDQFVIGFYAFEYFTVLSNIFIGLVGLALIVFNVKNLIKDENNIPKVLEIIKYVASSAVGVTMLTVIFFLGPTQGFEIMYKSINLFMHLISPLLAILSFVILEGKPNKKFYVTAFSILPVLIYGAVYLFNVLVFGTWNDFYGFNANGLWYVSYIAMLAAAYAIGVGIYYLTKLVSLNKEKAD